MVKYGQFGVADVDEIAEGLSIKNLALEKNTAGIENSVNSVSMDDEVDLSNEYREEQYQEEEEEEMYDGVCREAVMTTENNVSSEDS